jgi:RNA 2',3'-cyclic 3'-phosphodiesterase
MRQSVAAAAGEHLSMRCFIAVWPDRQARAHLVALSTRIAANINGGRVMRTENLHLTLAFIGSLDDERAQRIAFDCQQINMQPVVWRLDRLVHFARARVLATAGPHEPSLESLAQTVREMLDRSATDYDRKAFSPHITLLRDVARNPAGQDFAPIECELAGLAVYESRPDSRGVTYRRVGETGLRKLP